MAGTQQVCVSGAAVLRPLQPRASFPTPTRKFVLLGTTSIKWIKKYPKKQGVAEATECHAWGPSWACSCVTSGPSLHLSEPHCLHPTNNRGGPVTQQVLLRSRCTRKKQCPGWPGGGQPAGTAPRSPLGPLTLLSLGPSGQAVGSSRLRSSPSRMEEDLSEFREKASVSASCTCRERWPPQVTLGAGRGQAWSSRKTQAGSYRGRDLLSMEVMPPCTGDPV